uniref:Uncharacterized protein n=1 Tax=Helianthus annuus TaxID=4232 RepID=A0A251VP76_HELAN
MKSTAPPPSVSCHYGRRPVAMVSGFRGRWNADEHRSATRRRRLCPDVPAVGQ